MQEQEEDDVSEWSSAWEEFRRAVAAPGRTESLQDVVSRRQLSLAAISDDDDGSDDDDEKKAGRDGGSSAQQLGIAYGGLTAAERRDVWAWHVRLSRAEVFGRYYFPEQWEWREMETIRKFLALKDPKEAPEAWSALGQESTKKAVASIFFPGDFDAKSVLLKRGPILVEGTEERELLLFSHGFVLSRITFETLVDVLKKRKPGRNRSSLSPFAAIDSDNSGTIDRCELAEAFSEMQVPVGEKALDNIMERFDANGDGVIDLKEFQEACEEQQPKNARWGYLGAVVGDKIRHSLGGGDPPKVAGAYDYRDVEGVDSLNISYDTTNELFATSSWAETVFAVRLRGKDVPLVLVCAKPEQRLAWVEALTTCVAQSMRCRAASELHAARERIASLEKENDLERTKARQELVKMDERIKAELDGVYKKVAKCIRKKDAEIEELKKRVEETRHQ